MSKEFNLPFSTGGSLEDGIDHLGVSGLGIGGEKGPQQRPNYPSSSSSSRDSSKGEDPYSNTFKPSSKYSSGNIYSWRNIKISIQTLLRTTLEVILVHKRLSVVVATLLILSLFTSTPFIPHLSISDPKVVIILAANEGGGVLKWKGPQEWSVERSSIANKKQYAKQHGYGLTIKDMTIKKRYSHEWRESWEKVDIMKQTMRQFPNAEWFWWLDLHTYIMEPQLSLEEHFLNNLGNATYRTLDTFNPLGLPLDIPYVNYENQPIDMIITQDCGGFNLGSFLMRRSSWSEMLLDVWWDPALYEQMHMQWEHKEQDALESLYSTQAWIRERVGFLPLRTINSFPPGACSDKADDPQYFFQNKDFVINMAGCEWGRDCWGEMEHYKALSKRLHKKWWHFT
ncbi:probable alpha-1,6-mannosyltransferase Mnn10p [[Candida] railenensis]|uniref:Probable alpha-1,6-mannosyltransferase Mnn10p n=1 Tax=[Candida] railenensis TaxID=45579 RepID=A0A9P0VVV9_9ASCO|nr:probable alpha-1,6-mannosyltransferase Mnn10p [[Candida] railenensis]